MSHMLVYEADELHFLKALALVVWFSKRCISTGEVRSYGFKLAFPDGEGGTASRWIWLIPTQQSCDCKVLLFSPSPNSASPMVQSKEKE